MKKEFLLVMGVSGVGKTTYIQNIIRENPNLTYVTPITDRKLRNGEIDKVSVSKEDFNKMQEAGEFLVVNELYTHRYGTPRFLIDQILEAGKTPILDFPLNCVEKLSCYKDILKRIYLIPPTLGTLHQRLIQGDREERFEEGKKELLELTKNHFKHKDIDQVVISKRT